MLTLHNVSRCTQFIYLFIFYKSNKSNTHRVQRMKIPAFSYPAWNYGDSSEYDCGKCTPSYGLWLAWGRYRKKEERKKIWYILVTLLYTWWTVNCITSAPMRGSERDEKNVRICSSYLRFQDMVRYSFVGNQLSFRFTFSQIVWPEKWKIVCTWERDRVE